MVEKIATDVSSRTPRGKKLDGKRRGQLVLASASPRRLALLEQVGISPVALRPATIDETPAKAEMPRTLANRLALAKAQAALKIVREEKELANAYILAADTVVAVGRKILAKPETIDEAASALYQLSARSHRVYTTICLITPENKVRNRLVETKSQVHAPDTRRYQRLSGHRRMARQGRVAMPFRGSQRPSSLASRALTQMLSACLCAKPSIFCAVKNIRFISTGCPAVQLMTSGS